MRYYKVNGKKVKAASSIFKREYRFPELTRLDKLQHEMALIGELDIQKWYALSYSQMMKEEVVIYLQ